jgi:hypothetical protein
MIPHSVQVTILADRGFGRAEMPTECQKLQLGYIIRIEPKTYVKGHGFTGKLIDLPIRPGQQVVLYKVLYRKYKPVRQHIAAVWRIGESEPWFLMTNLDKLAAKRLTKIFGRWMTIQQYSRNNKSRRNGFALRLTLIKDTDRLSRFLLILALAYILLVTIGLYAGKVFHPRRRCSNNCVSKCSPFTIGTVMVNQHLPALEQLLRALTDEILLQNWG